MTIHMYKYTCMRIHLLRDKLPVQDQVAIVCYNRALCRYTEEKRPIYYTTTVIACNLIVSNYLTTYRLLFSNA